MSTPSTERPSSPTSNAVLYLVGPAVVDPTTGVMTVVDPHSVYRDATQAQRAVGPGETVVAR